MAIIELVWRNSLPDQFGRLVTINCELAQFDTENEILIWNRAYCTESFWGQNISDMSEQQLMHAIRETGEILQRGQIQQADAELILDYLNAEVLKRAKIHETKTRKKKSKCK